MNESLRKIRNAFERLEYLARAKRIEPEDVAAERRLVEVELEQIEGLLAAADTMPPPSG